MTKYHCHLQSSPSILKASTLFQDEQHFGKALLHISVLSHLHHICCALHKICIWKQGQTPYMAYRWSILLLPCDSLICIAVIVRPMKSHQNRHQSRHQNLFRTTTTSLWGTSTPESTWWTGDLSFQCSRSPYSETSNSLTISKMLVKVLIFAYFQVRRHYPWLHRLRRRGLKSSLESCRLIVGNFHEENLSH